MQKEDIPMYNKNDIPRLESELKAAIGTPEYEIVNCNQAKDLLASCSI